MTNIFAAPDRGQIRALLTSNDLPTDDLDGLSLGNFLGCGERQHPGGVVGLEVLGDVGLLRSLAVSPENRGRGCGKALVVAAESLARESGLSRLYLLTTTADGFFARLGYTVVERGEVPAVVLCSREFSSLCPQDAVVMTKAI